MMLKQVFLVCIITLFKHICAYTTNFDDCYSVYYTTEDKSYEMAWNGRRIYSLCGVTFHGYDRDHILNKYKVCIRASTWNVTNSDVKLKYYSSRSGFIYNNIKTYSMHNISDPTHKWCADEDYYVTVELVPSMVSDNQGRITLYVTAVKTYTYHYGITSYWTYGGVGLGITCISVIIAVIRVCFVLRMRRKNNGKQITSGSSSTDTVKTQSGSQQMTGFPGNTSASALPGYTNWQAQPSNMNSTVPLSNYPSTPKFAS